MANEDLTKQQTDGLDQRLRELNAELLISSVRQHELAEKWQQAERHLRISEEQFRLGITNSPIPVIMHAEDGEVLTVSESWTRLTGYTVEDADVIQDWLTEAYGYGGDCVREAMHDRFLPPVDENEVMNAVVCEIVTREGEVRTWSFNASVPGLLSDGRRFAVGMAEDVTDRIRTEAALRESEEKYRTLFESIDEGFCLLEILFHESGEPYDYVFLEANVAFERQSGLVDAVGRSILELVPGLEAQWIKTYAQVVKTGEPVRFEADVASMDRVFDIYAFKSGRSEDNKVAVVFNDITARKRHEANLAFLSEVSSDLVHQKEIGGTMEMLGAKIGTHFRATRLGFFEMNDDADEAVCQYDWHASSEDTSLVGTHRIADFYTDIDDFANTLRAGQAFVLGDGSADSRMIPESLMALDIRSFIAVPDGGKRLRLVLALYDSHPRDWTKDEIDLLREVATRIWTRLERARAEHAVLESQERLRLALDAAEMGTFLWYPQEDRTEMDPRALRVLGLGEGDTMTLASALAEAIHPDDRELYASAVAAAIDPKGDRKLDLDYRVVHPDQSVHWLHIYGHTFFSGGNSPHPTLMYGMVLDITERKRSEEMVAGSELRMRLAINAANMYSWEIDVGTRTITISEDSAEVLGFGRVEGLADVSEQVATIIHPDDQALVSKALEQAYETGHLRQEMRFIVPGTDEIVWAEARGTVRRDADGNSVKLYGVTQNITERKRAEATLARYSDELEATVRVRTRELRETNKGLKAENKERRRLEAERLSLLAAITTVQEDERRRMARDLHDHFGQQLIALMYRIDFLSNPSYADDRFQQMVADAQTLVRQIDKDLDALSFDLRPPSLDDIGLAASLQDYVGEWSRRFQIPAHFQARRFGRKRLPPDSETHIYRITQEILTNIQKHADANLVDVSLEKRQGVAILSVTDDGIGFHLKAGMSKRVGSGGMGLVGMRERAAIIGGTLEIVSVADVGTKITLRVPIPGARIVEKNG